MRATFHLHTQEIPRLKGFLDRTGFKFEERPHQLFLARAEGCTISAYANGTVTVSASDKTRYLEVKSFLTSIGVQKEQSSSSDRLSRVEGKTRIGIDEAGKGDYFGPLVISAVMITRPLEARLRKIGVRDSKKLKPHRLARIASLLRKEFLDPGQYHLVRIRPRRYNELIEKMGTVNALLSWGHATALEEVLRFPEPCAIAISDQFGNQTQLEAALKKRGQRMELIQEPHAESDLAVATASILARNDFLREINALSRTYDEKIPLGSSKNVEEFAARFLSTHGWNALASVAKTHFSTTQKVLKSLRE